MSNRQHLEEKIELLTADYRSGQLAEDEFARLLAEVLAQLRKLQTESYTGAQLLTES